MNRITNLFKIDIPIIQGGMVWCSGWKLATAVSNAGGLGLIGAGIYVVILTLFGEFTFKDMKLFLRITNPIQLINYARYEVKSGFFFHLSTKEQNHSYANERHRYF